MRKLCISLLISLILQIPPAYAVLPYIFATQPAGNVPASYLDTNFTFVENQGVQAITTTGTSNAYIATPPDAWVTGYSFYAGRALTIIPNFTNSSNSTINVSGIGAVSIIKSISGGVNQLQPGDLTQGVPALLICDGVNFWLSTPAAAGQIQGIGPITITGTGNASFYTSQTPPAVINRFQDRTFFGSAVANDGKASPSVTDWNFLYTGYSEISSGSPNGSIGVTGGTRTSDNTSGTTQTSDGVVGICWNDNVSQQQLCNGGFFLGRRASGAGTSLGTTGVTISIADEGTAVSPTPYLDYQGGGYTPGLVLYSGGTAAASNASNALSIGSNFPLGQFFNAGIVFGSTALAGDNGTTGTAPAILFAKGHAVQWYEPNGTIGYTIRSDEASGDAVASTTVAGGIITQTKTNIVGTIAGDSAPAGDVGQYISSNLPLGSAVSLTSGAATNVTSISLTAGDWDVFGNVGYQANAGTTSTSFLAGISTTSATFPANNGSFSAITGPSFTSGSSPILSCSPIRINVSTTTTVYLITLSNFTGSTNSAYGMISARRVR